jgi:nucleoid-associated protein YgaU
MWPQAKTVVPLLVLVIGVAVAMPFLKATVPPRTASRPDPADVELRPRVSLNVAQPSGESPAISLYDSPSPSPSTPVLTRPPVIRSVAPLDGDVPPPRLSPTRGPSVDNRMPTQPSRPARESVARSDPPAPKPAGSGEPWFGSQEARPHKIVDGDTLADLAERYLGRADRWIEIYEANRDVLPSPDVLPLGITITIPPPRTGAPVTPTARDPSLVPIPAGALARPSAGG